MNGIEMRGCWVLRTTPKFCSFEKKSYNWSALYDFISQPSTSTRWTWILQTSLHVVLPSISSLARATLHSGLIPNGNYQSSLGIGSKLVYTVITTAFTNYKASPDSKGRKKDILSLMGGIVNICLCRQPARKFFIKFRFYHLNSKVCWNQ